MNSVSRTHTLSMCMICNTVLKPYCRLTKTVISNYLLVLLSFQKKKLKKWDFQEMDIWNSHFRQLPHSQGS